MFIQFDNIINNKKIQSKYKLILKNTKSRYSHASLRHSCYTSLFSSRAHRPQHYPHPHAQNKPSFSSRWNSILPTFVYPENWEIAGHGTSVTPLSFVLSCTPAGHKDRQKAMIKHTFKWSWNTKECWAINNIKMTRGGGEISLWFRVSLRVGASAFVEDRDRGESFENRSCRICIFCNFPFILNGPRKDSWKS